MNRGNHKNHLLCYDCGHKHNVDVLVRTNQGTLRAVCLNCATKPEYKNWCWRCFNNNCMRPIFADHYMYCETHYRMWMQG